MTDIDLLATQIEEQREEIKRLKESLLYYRTHRNRAVQCHCGNTFYAPLEDLDCPFCEEQALKGD